jgi:hypothetical protein
MLDGEMIESKMDFLIDELTVCADMIRKFFDTVYVTTETGVDIYPDTDLKFRQVVASGQDPDEVYREYIDLFVRFVIDNPFYSLTFLQDNGVDVSDLLLFGDEIRALAIAGGELVVDDSDT